MTRVLNLRTGQELFYSCRPGTAVVCADEQAHGNWNTWTYDFSRAQISRSGHTVSCGDFCALAQPREILGLPLED